MLKKKKKCFHPFQMFYLIQELIQKTQPPLILLCGSDSLGLEALVFISVLAVLVYKQLLPWQRDSSACKHVPLEPDAGS